MAGRLSSLLGVLRPRTIARTAKSVDDLVTASRDLKRRVRDLEHRETGSDGRLSAVEAEMKALRDALAEVQLREARLRAVYQRDVEEEPAFAALDGILDASVIQTHAARSIECAALHLDPFPHLVAENLFPQPFYDAVIRGIPPVELFDGSDNKQRIVVPFEMAPAYSRRVWGFLLREIIDAGIGPAVIRKFLTPLSEWLDTTWPGLGAELLASRLPMQTTDGRILLRRRGYVITPHRDPKWGFITVLLYLARPGDSPEWGTQLYAVDDDAEAESVAPLWIRAERCRFAKDVPFRANTALIFMNGMGAHGARIPADAEPADLERYAYQFRIGPTGASIRRLLAALPDEQRRMWSGKAGDYN